jgi:hypothetical protein
MPSEAFMLWMPMSKRTCYAARGEAGHAALYNRSMDSAARAA